MAGKQTRDAGRYLESLFGVGTDIGLTDDQLLARFVSHRDHAAFEALVRRHGPMVVSVCRGMLADPNDSQDAFQATFLVLVRKARSIRAGTSLGSWLYRVACNLAIQINVRAARRRRIEREAAEMAHPVASDPVCGDDLVPALYEEVHRLPDKYRLPVVLCHLEEMTHTQAARQLGWTEGMVRGRVARAREVLRRRLARRGLALSAAGVASALSDRSARSAAAALASGWTDATVRAAMVIAAGGAPTGTVSAAAVALSERMVRGLFMTQLKLTAAALLAACGTAFAVAALVAAGPDDGAVRQDATRAAPRAISAAPAKADGLSKPFPVAGVVVDSTSGKPVAGVAVLVRRTVGDQPGGEQRLESDASGRFRLDLPADWEAPAEARVAVSVHAPPGHAGFPYRTQYGRPTDEGIPLAELRREQELGVPPYFGTFMLFPTKRIAGRVAAPDGSPAAGVDVVACSVPLKDKATPPHRAVRRARTGADGRFEAEVASPGPAVVYFLSDRYAPRAVKLTDPAGDLGVYTLEAGVQVHGKLRDALDRPLANRWVRVGATANRTEIDEELWHVGLGSVARWCRTIADGTFHTAPLAPGVYEASAHGPGRDALGDRKRLGEPLEACVVPQKVTVPADGEMPRTVLRAVPHVVIEVRVADRQGRIPACQVTVPYRYTFDGKEYWDVIDANPGVTAVGGRAKFFVPHGTPMVNLSNGVIFDDAAVNWSFDLPVSGPYPRIKDGDVLMGPFMLLLRNVERDRTVNVVWAKGAVGSLKITSARGAVPAVLRVDARHSGLEPCSAVPVGEGVYRFYRVRADTPLTVTVSPEGKAEVTRSFTLAADRPQQVEIVLEDNR